MKRLLDALDEFDLREFLYALRDSTMAVVVAVLLTAAIAVLLGLDPH